MTVGWIRNIVGKTFRAFSVTPAQDLPYTLSRTGLYLALSRISIIPAQARIYLALGLSSVIPAESLPRT